MSKRSDLQDHLKRVLPPEEEVVVATFAQVKGELKKQLGKTVAKGVAASLAVSAVTGGPPWPAGRRRPADGLDRGDLIASVAHRDARGRPTTR
jgi:hypothetical protein